MLAQSFVSVFLHYHELCQHRAQHTWFWCSTVLQYCWG